MGKGRERERERRKVTKPDEVGWAIYEWWCNGRCEILVARRKQRLLTTTLLLCNEEREKNTEAVRKVDEKERNWLVFITSDMGSKRKSIQQQSTPIGPRFSLSPIFVLQPVARTKLFIIIIVFSTFFFPFFSRKCYTRGMTFWYNSCRQFIE